MNRHTKRRIPAGKILARLFLWGLIAVGAALGYLQGMGFPAWAKDRLLARCSGRRISIEADSLRLRPLSGLSADSVRIYRKHRVGPAVLTAERVDVFLNPVFFLAGRPPVHGVRIRGGFMDAEMTAEDKQARAALPSRTRGDGDSGTAGGPGSKPTARLRLELVDCTVCEVAIDRLECRLLVHGLDWAAEDIQAAISRRGKSGSWSGSCTYRAKERRLRGRVATQLNPEILQPCFQAWELHGLSAFIQRFDFGTSAPRCEGEFDSDLANDGVFETKGRVWIEDASYRRVFVERADAKLDLRLEGGHLLLSIDPLYLTRPEGQCRVRFAYDGKKDDVKFDGDSTLDHKALIAMLGILTKGELDGFAFGGDSRASGSGVVSFRDRLKTDFKVDVKCGRIEWGRLVAGESSFAVGMTGTTNWIDGFNAFWYGGRLTGKAALTFDPESFTNTGYEVSLQAADVNCTEFRDVLGSAYEGKLQGKLSGSLRVTGPPGTNVLQNMAGSGDIAIRDGRVFSLPLFGGFSRIMTRTIPGLDFVLRQTDAAAQFTLADGRMHSDEIRINGDILSLSGYGDYRFDGQLEFSARVTLMKEHTLVAKLVAPLVYPISKLFEFRLRGTTANPDWYPTNFSKEMLQRLGLVQTDEPSD